MNLYQVDAFTDEVFKGNPAAICLLEGHNKDERWMQSMATEMNLSETAFIKRIEEGYHLRWFTPKLEVNLCGHATLASAHVLWDEGIHPKNEPIQFHTRSGILKIIYTELGIQMQFPKLLEQDEIAPKGLLEALNVKPLYVGKSKEDYIIELGSEEDIYNLSPDFALLKKVETRGVMVTARSKGQNYDFISRFFGPKVGINEDPVTGSAHCVLAPYWMKKLSKNKFKAYQASERGGILDLEVVDSYVFITGKAVTVFKAELSTIALE